jgi:energy-coupling factor transport system substrate-specific component
VSWQAGSSGLLALVVAGGFAWYERVRPSARVLGLVAALAALAVVGRLAFAAIPNVKPTTDIVLFAGYALGAVPGFAVGAVTALVSNIFLSQGPWTVWQMAGWGAVGATGAMLARAARGGELGRIALALACGAAGLAFGAWMDVYQWTYAARQDLDSYLAVSASSLPYNLAHALGNVVFCLLIGPPFVRALRRYRRRFEVRWRVPVVSAALLLLALGLPAAAAASPSELAARYLLRAQNRDGGFGAAPRQASSQLYTGWAALGLAAAGRNSRDVRRRGGRSITGYVIRRGRSIRDVGEVERTILVLAAAGLSPRRFAGRDLVAELRARRRADGSIAGYVSYTAFGILALRAAEAPPGASSLAWLARSQNEDGGFGVSRSSASDTDMTGAVLQALAAAGRGGGDAVRRATAYLGRSQNRDGGFGQVAGRTSNAQSTAYAVQGLVAVGAADRAVNHALSYLRRLQRPDGSVAYARGSHQAPVWVTAQALAALRRKPLPLARVPRAGGRARRPASVERAAPKAAGARPPKRSSPASPARAAPRRRSGSRAAAAQARVDADRASPRPPAGTSPGERDGGSLPGPLFAGAGLALLALLAVLRRRLRLRRG